MLFIKVTGLLNYASNLNIENTIKQEKIREWSFIINYHAVAGAYSIQYGLYVSPN